MKGFVITILFVAAAGTGTISASPVKDPVQYGNLDFGLDQYEGSRSVQAAPPTIAQLLQAILKAVNNWFSDLIKHILGITASELIKSINSALVGLRDLITKVIMDLEQLIGQVDTVTQRNLRSVIDNYLNPGLEIIEPILEQLQLILLYLPEAVLDPVPAAAAVANTRSGDIVSDLVEALLGMTLEEFLALIKSMVINFNTALTNTVDLVNQIVQQVPPELAAEIEAGILTALEKALRDILPILNSLNRLPIY